MLVFLIVVVFCKGCFLGFGPISWKEAIVYCGCTFAKRWFSMIPVDPGAKENTFA